MGRKPAFNTGDDKVGKATRYDADISYKKTYAVVRVIKNMTVPRAL